MDTEVGYATEIVVVRLVLVRDERECQPLYKLEGEEEEGWRGKERGRECWFGRWVGLVRTRCLYRYPASLGYTWDYWALVWNKHILCVYTWLQLHDSRKHFSTF